MKVNIKITPINSDVLIECKGRSACFHVSRSKLNYSSEAEMIIIDISKYAQCTWNRDKLINKMYLFLNLYAFLIVLFHDL